MIKHIVMFRLKDAQGKTAFENAEEARIRAEKLPSLIPVIRKMEVITGAQNAPESNFHIALICEFDDMDALNVYQEHPEHKKFGEFIFKIREENGRACIDAEI